VSWSSNSVRGLGAAIAASACAHAVALALLQPASVGPDGRQPPAPREQWFQVQLEEQRARAAGAAAPAGANETAAPERLTPVLPAVRYYTTRELDGIPGPLTQIEPAYPESAARRHLGGSVVVRLFIDEGGHVERVVTLRADPPGYFEESVRQAFGVARFTPGIRKGRPVKAQLTLAVSFDAPPPPLPSGG
jgi:TonB family protein